MTDSIGRADPDASRAKLKELILPEIEKLRVRVKMLRPYETQMRLQAREREMVDTSREGELRLRYESMHRRDFHRAIRELERYRKAFSDIDFDQAEGTYGSPVHEDVFAPNEPVVTPPDRVESHPATPMVVPRLGNPEVKADLQESKKRLGICPVPFERLNELIDNSIPNLNGLLKWADELEAERNAKAKSDEMLM